MFPIQVYHGSEKENVTPTKDAVLYVTSHPSYPHIQKSPHVYSAQFYPKAPYWTDRIDFVEGLKNRPERCEQLKALGYDAVVYAQKGNPFKGASGWGDDLPQFVSLSPSTLVGWAPCNKPSPYFEVSHKVVSSTGPLYHGTSTHFVSFELGDEIGIHFGTKQAAHDRLTKTHQEHEVEIYHNEPLPLDLLRHRYSQHETAEGLSDMVYGMMLRKLGNPKNNLKSVLNAMSLEELAEVSEEYSVKPDHANYLNSMKRVREGESYDVMCNGECVFSTQSNDEALAVKKIVSGGLMKQVELFCQSPLHLDDLGSWTPHAILYNVPGGEQHFDQLAECDSDKDKFDLVRRAIKEAGYDSISYDNQVEDQGSLSYIAIEPSTIVETPLDLAPLIDLDRKREGTIEFDDTINNRRSP